MIINFTYNYIDAEVILLNYADEEFGLLSPVSPILIAQFQLVWKILVFDYDHIILIVYNFIYIFQCTYTII